MSDFRLRGKTLPQDSPSLAAEQVQLLSQLVGSHRALGRLVGASNATVHKWTMIGCSGPSAYALRVVAREWRAEYLDRLVDDINAICDMPATSSPDCGTDALDTSEAKSDN